MYPVKVYTPRVIIALCALACMVVAGQKVAPVDQPVKASKTSERMSLSGNNTLSSPLQNQPQTELMLLDEPARSISFQALLTNDQGNPINNPNGEHELDFRIYDNSGGGTPVGEILDVLVTLHQGVASTSVGPFDPTWFDGTARWMGVTVDNGSELAPLIKMGVVPYAFRVDRVASEELDDHIDLGDVSNGGSLSVFSGDVTPETITLDGPAGALTVRHPSAQGRINLHGFGQLIETVDNSGTTVALFGQDAFSGGGACLLGTAAGTTGLQLDGDAIDNSGGVVRLFNDQGEEAASMTAGNGTIRAGSISGGVAGHLHLHPSAGGPSFIHLNGSNAEERIGVSGIASGSLSLYSVSGGTERINLRGHDSMINLNNGSNDTVSLDGDNINDSGELILRNSAGTNTLSFDGNNADVSSTGKTFHLNRINNQNVTLAAGGGNVGIGTTTPNHELVVQGDDPAFQIRDDVTDNSANAARIELLERAGGAYDGGAFLWWNGETNKFHIGTKSSGNNTSVIVVDRATDNVGIGTSTPGNYRLAVNGPIRAKEIVVETGWSDFVFEKDYKLLSLAEVESHIKDHGHLPDVPSAEDVAKNGIAVGEMESKLLQKVEELTLHLIDMNKRLQTLEKENTKLRQGVNHKYENPAEVK